LVAGVMFLARCTPGARYLRTPGGAIRRHPGELPLPDIAASTPPAYLRSAHVYGSKRLRCLPPPRPRPRFPKSQQRTTTRRQLLRNMVSWLRPVPLDGAISNAGTEVPALAYR
jgi:hypothetical protein